VSDNFTLINPNKISNVVVLFQKNKNTPLVEIVRRVTINKGTKKI